MTPSSIFSFGNTFVLLGWVLLIVIPNWKYTQAIVLNGVVAVLSILYAFMIIKDIGSFDPESFNTLENVKVLFQSDSAVAAGWLHYLAFDLLVGAYIVKKSKEIELSRWIYTPILFLTFMFGPIGYLSYFIAKVIKLKSLNELS